MKCAFCGCFAQITFDSPSQLDPIQMQKFKITENELAERKAFVDKAEKVLNSKFGFVNCCDKI